MPLFTCVLCAVISAAPPAENPTASAWTATQLAALPDSVRSLAYRFCDAGHWRDRRKVAEELIDHGDDAVAALLVILQSSQDSSQLWDASYFLREHFPNHTATKEFILTQGLSSPHGWLRYESLYHVGEQKWPEAREQLYAHLGKKKGQSDSWNRFVAAKSLGELGDERALLTLLEAVQHENYMPRHFGNIGLKALTGKSLEDFDYKYGEGAHVTGGREMLFLNPDPFTEADHHARRYSAYRDFLKLLRDNRPELYEVVKGPQF